MCSIDSLLAVASLHPGFLLPLILLTLSLLFIYFFFETQPSDLIAWNFDNVVNYWTELLKMIS